MEKNVAIIEDSEIIADLVSKFVMDKFSCPVKVFHTAEDYLASGNHTSLILLDYYLDKKDKQAMNGLEFMRAMDARRENEAPVIMISGLTDEGIINELKGHKIVGFIDKDAPEFWTRLEREIRKIF